jgi:lipoate-protein ligase A
MNREWQFLDAGEHSGQFNMDSDTSLVENLLHGSGFPTLRLYTWKPWAISLGYNQDSSELDGAFCKEVGIDVVRRPTGGRAILHAEELTYAVAMPANSSSILVSYNSISRALLRGLSFFGVDATFEQSQPRFREVYRKKSSIACFSSSARYEIQWAGRKLVGSAQRRMRSKRNAVLLQHGSILCGPAHRRLVEFLRGPTESDRKGMEQDLKEKTVDLSEIVGGIDMTNLAQCIKRGFESEWGIEFVHSSVQAKGAA